MSELHDLEPLVAGTMAIVRDALYVSMIGELTILVAILLLDGALPALRRWRSQFRILSGVDRDPVAAMTAIVRFP